MSPIFKTIARWVLIFIDPRKIQAILYLPRYVSHWSQYQAGSIDKIRVADSYPCLSDWVSSTPYDPHYFYQGAWLARRLAEVRPDQHVDIASSVLTVGVISAHVPTIFVDYRPLNAKLPNLQNIAGTIMSLPFPSGSVSSLSCMHVLEHIGLGRYGDPIDPMGARKAAGELVRVLAPGGQLYLTMPVGRQRVCFNAHRVFSPTEILDLFLGLNLRSFSWVDDAGEFHSGGQPCDAAKSEYGCGFYELQKPL